MDCTEYRNRLERSLAGPGVPLLEAEAAEHLKTCRECSQYWEALQLEGIWIDTLADEEPVPDSILDRVKDAVRDARPVSFRWKFAAVAAAVSGVLLPFLGTLWIGTRPGIDAASVRSSMAEESDLIVYLLSSLVRSIY